MTNAKEIAIYICATHNIPKALAEEIVDDVFDYVAYCLSIGHEVKLHKFGTFKVKNTKARIGRNPKTGEALEIPEKNVVKFVPFSALKNIANEK